jgi:serine protease Do
VNCSPRSTIALLLTVALGLVLLTPLTTSARPIGGARRGTFAALAEAVKPAVINVSTDRGRGETEPHVGGHGPQRSPWRGLGAGVIIEASGLALTNAHVIEAGGSIEVTTADGQRYPARLVGSDRKTDLAVIRLQAPGKTFPALHLGDSDAVRVGDWVIAVGSPFGLSATVTSGVLSAKARHVGAGSHDGLLQTDAAINPGNSGGPLVNMRGEVIGINTAIVRGSAGIGFAVPSNTARRVAAELLAGDNGARGWRGATLSPRAPEVAARSKDRRAPAPGDPAWGWLGLGVQALTPDVAPPAGVRTRAGLLVATVEPGGAAALAGIRAGDVLLAIDGTPVRSIADLDRLTQTLKLGQPFSVRLEREGRALYVAVGAARG